MTRLRRFVEGKSAANGTNGHNAASERNPIARALALLPCRVLPMSEETTAPGMPRNERTYP